MDHEKAKTGTSFMIGTLRTNQLHLTSQSMETKEEAFKLVDELNNPEVPTLGVFQVTRVYRDK